MAVSAEATYVIAAAVKTFISLHACMSMMEALSLSEA